VESGLSIPSAQPNLLGFLGGRGELRHAIFNDPHLGSLNLDRFIGCKDEGVLQGLAPRIGRSAAYKLIYGIVVE
jgi:hypothetical protein